MKNWLTQIAVTAFAVAALAACKKDETKATLAPSASTTLTASRTSVVLAQANSAQTALTYSWTPVQFSLSNTESTKVPAVTYQLQLSKSADAFGYPAIIDAGTNTSKAVTVSDLNTALTTIGVTAGTATPVSVRVVAVTGTDNHSFASNVVPLTATSYTVCLPPNADTWSIIGPAGVDWNTDVPLTYNCTTRTYDVTRALNVGEFKFRKNSDWGVNYGSSVNTGGPLVSGGNNIAVATAGTYTIKLDLTNQTFSIR